MSEESIRDNAKDWDVRQRSVVAFKIVDPDDFTPAKTECSVKLDSNLGITANEA